MIEINHLVKKYGDHYAVNDLTFTVEPGRIYGFLGPNGAGKSTTMNIITGYLGATSGDVKINGHDILSEPEEAKKCVGYLPEIPPLYVDMTVKEYLSFVADLKKVDKSMKSRYIGEAMEMTKITEMKNRLIKNLSKGYKQRVGLAQAVLGYPEVIILDEPTVGLDPKQIIEIRDLIRKLGEKHTVILSSHILSEVREVCDYIFIISEGRLVANDTTENLLNEVNGQQEIVAIVKGDGTESKNALSQIQNVDKLIAKAGEEAETTELHIKAKKNTDIRSQVFQALANAHAEVLEMKADGKTLEDIFLELTTGKGGEA